MQSHARFTQRQTLIADGLSQSQASEENMFGYFILWSICRRSSTASCDLHYCNARLAEVKRSAFHAPLAEDYLTYTEPWSFAHIVDWKSKVTAR